MRKVFLVLGLLILAYFSFGFYFATFDLKINKKAGVTQNHPLYYDYRGVSHVVTSFSKGSAAPTDILLQADQAGLDFMFLTDLNQMERPYNLTGYQGHVFTFSNQKVSHLDSHILIYTDNPDFYFDSLSAANAQLYQHFSEPASKDKNFLAVLAHPFKKNHQWTGEYPIGLDGIEVINMRHLWQETWFNERFNFIWSILIYPFNPEIALLRLINEPQKELKLWDQLTLMKPTLGFLGNETTAKIFNILGLNFTFPSYKTSFEFASNHILLPSELTGQVTSDRKKIFSSIKNGHFYLAFDSLGDPKGFAAYLSQGKKVSLIGSEVEWEKNTQLVVDLPGGLNVPVSVEVFRNGNSYFRSDKMKTVVEITQPGVYRVTVKMQPLLPLPDRKKWIPWIYTNPIYVR